MKKLIELMADNDLQMEFEHHDEGLVVIVAERCESPLTGSVVIRDDDNLSVDDFIVAYVQPLVNAINNARAE